jgi:DinB family protein
MIGLPKRSEAAPYYFKYIDRISSDDIVGQLEAQLNETVGFFSGISEEKSLHRYEPDKWSIRQLVSHVIDTERVFLSRAFWFARGFDSPLPSYDEKASASAARADDVPWANHIEDFRAVRRSTLTFFRNLPADAWMRSGTASDNPFTVRALAYIIAGHAAHHTAILRERYL